MADDKTCTVCEERKPRTEFYRDRHRNDGLMVRCSECERQRQRDNYEAAEKPPCSVCGDDLPLYKRVVCSDDCRRQWLYESDAYQQAQKNRDPNSKHPPTERNCIVCQRSWAATTPDARYCNDCSARSEWYRQRRMPVPHPNPAPVTVIPPQHPARQEPAKPSPLTWVAGRCASCDEAFVSWQPYSRYCSPHCGKREARRRRRARRYGANCERFSDAYIYERDRWICQICGRKTRPDYNYMHPLAPTIDHIIPLSVGGNHTRRNTQTTHRQCNSQKSDRTAPGGDQLRLIG